MSGQDAQRATALTPQPRASLRPLRFPIDGANRLRVPCLEERRIIVRGFGRRLHNWKKSAVLLFLLAGLHLPASVQAALQFDVFVGYDDGIVPEASWFPVVCEAKNDGPSFRGTIEVTLGNTINDEQIRLLPVELPTGTLKRFVIPVFSTSRNFSSWNVRLLDERRRVLAKQVATRPTKQVASDVPLLGSLARTSAGTPLIRQCRRRPTSKRRSSRSRRGSSLKFFPTILWCWRDSAWLYLSSERVSQLRDSQVNALYRWLYAGGHLIVGVEQLTDINSTPWLKPLLPCELTDIHTVPQHPELQKSG